MQEAPSVLHDAVKRELSGERVLWAGVPTRWGYARSKLKTALGGIPFTAFALLWTFMASSIPAKEPTAFRMVFPLWGLMFVAVGLSMLLSPLFQALLAGRVYYAVTERRAVIFQKRLGLKIHSFHVSGFGGFERISHGGDSGDIVFRREVERGSKGGLRTTETGFMGLGNTDRAEKALEEMLERAKSR